MKRATQIISILIVLGFISMITVGLAFGQSPHYTTADAYTTINYPDDNFGTEPYLMLAASNTPDSGCVKTSFLWFKFNVPNPTTTISFATLSVPIDPIYAGNEALPMEVHSSSNTSWTETGITYNNSKDHVDATVLAISPSTPPGSDALFTSPELAAYLNAHKGQTVTLVVMANCAASPAPATDAVRVVKALQHTDSSQVELLLQGPTAVEVKTLTARSPSLSTTIVSVSLLLSAIMLAIRLHKRQKLS